MASALDELRGRRRFVDDDYTGAHPRGSLSIMADRSPDLSMPLRGVGDGRTVCHAGNGVLWHALTCE